MAPSGARAPRGDVQEIRDFLERAGLDPVRGRSAIRAARRRRVVRHLAGARGLLRVLREARAWPPARGGGVARGCVAERHGGAMADACRQAQCRPRAGGPGVGFVARGVRDGVSAARPARAMEIAARTRVRHSRDRGHGRPPARLHTRRIREIVDGGGRVRHRRLVPRPSHRAVSSRDGARALQTSLPFSRRSPSEPSKRSSRSCTAISARRTSSWARAVRSFSTPSARGSATRRSILAFCLNHLLLKTLWVPSAERELLASFDALADAYLRGVDWEPAAALEQRAAQLLPALFLARIDGKSPVEYLTDDASKNAVRRAARSMLQQPLDRLEGVRRAWAGRTPEAGRSSAVTPARSDRKSHRQAGVGFTRPADR